MTRRLLTLLFLLLPGLALAGTQPQALILYDGASQNMHEGQVDGTYIANLMGHFGYRPTLQAIEDYNYGGMDKYDVVFVAGGSSKTIWPADVLHDARARTSTLVWVGYGMDSFLIGREAQKRGLRVESVQTNSRYNRVQYRDATLGKGSGMVTLLKITDPARFKVEAEMSDPDGNRAPYILHTGKLWLVADVPFAYITEQDRYLVFCDLLHDMLGVNHATSRKALIRLEDVTPDDDPDVLQKAIDVFLEEGVPFQISLVPVFVDPGARREVRLSERPRIIQVLHYAVAHGGTIVLHGYTHQYRGVTPDDFEFWDGFRNAPRADDSAQLVRDKLNAALNECFRSDLYPIAWETPHYAGSPVDYTEFAHVFSTFNEETMIDRQGTQQAFPFPTTDTRGNFIVPENIGYLPESDPNPQALIDNARAMMVVRDGIASGFVHDFLDVRLLQRTVHGIKELGYQFISLRDFDARVTMEDHLVVTGSAARNITLRDSYLRQFLIGRDGSHQQESWSTVRYTGSVPTTLQPGPGEILVAVGTDEQPAQPLGFMDRMKQKVAGAVSRWRAQAPSAAEARPMKVAVVWQRAAVGQASNDQESFANTFRAYGISPRQISIAELRNSTLDPDEVLVVPRAAALALRDADVASIDQFVRAGGQLILDGRSKLAEAVGIRYPGGTLTVEHVTDGAQVDLPLQWQPAVAMERFRVPDRATILTHDTDNHAGAAGVFSAGQGKVLYLGVLFDPYTPDGTSHYPFMFEHAMKAFDRAQLARRRSIELYFDPGLRPDVSIEDLAVLWRRMGVHVVYASAWNFDRRYTYDYDRLIRVCHANGIQVYAWFEFPQVSPLFWAEHPEWREVAGGGDKLPSWRQAMNLANPDCRTAALQFMSRVVNQWAWDGVNLAELSFDGKADGDKPWAMVPFNDNVRRDFRAKHHFDPKELLNPASPHFWRQDKKGWENFLTYRKEFVTELHRTFLTALKPFAASGREVIVTMYDSLEHPEITPDTGVDSEAIVDLIRDYGFTLQVEDPASAWKNPPSRYLRLAERYRSILPPNARFMIDINVVPNRDILKTHLPAAPAMGVELAATVRAARTASDRVALYGDATVRTADLELLSYAAADRATVSVRDRTWTIETPDSIEMAVSSGIHRFYRDGEDWPFWRSGYVLLPPGRHTISASRSWFHWFDTSGLTPQMLQVSGPLLAADTTPGGLELEYDSPAPVYACFSRKPAGASAEDTELAFLPGAREIGSVLVMPAGHHRVHIARSKGPALYLDFFSLISSSLIVAFGTGSILMLAVLYGSIRIRRFFRRAHA